MRILIISCEVYSIYLQPVHKFDGKMNILCTDLYEKYVLSLHTNYDLITYTRYTVLSSVVNFCISK